MLTDEVMAKLAEDCGWRLPDHESYREKVWLSNVGSRNAMMAYRKEDTWSLTDAGCWQAMKALNIDIIRGALGRTYASWQHAANCPSDALPETALMLAIQEVYADQEEV